MKKAYYIDSYSKHSLHEMFNASSLAIFSNLCPELEYRADSTSKKNVENILKKIPKNINYKSIFVFNDKNKISKLIKQIISTILNCFYIIKSDPSDIVIINYNTMMSIYPINFFTKIGKKKVVLICHGEMYDLKYSRKTSVVFRMSKMFFIKKNISIAKGLQFLVLGEFIHKNLKGIVSEQVYDKIISMDHTFIPSLNYQNESIVKLNDNDKIKIGIVGSLRDSKGFQELVLLIDNVRKRNKLIEFVIIGSYNNSSKALTDLGFTIPKEVDGSFLSREKLLSLIASLDYSLYLLPKDIYEFTASGSFFDSLDCQIPIIGLRNDFFSYYEKNHGKYGFLFDAIEEIAEFLSVINTTNFTNFDYKKIKENLSIVNMSNNLYFDNNNFLVNKE